MEPQPTGALRDSCVKVSLAHCVHATYTTIAHGWGVERYVRV